MNLTGKLFLCQVTRDTAEPNPKLLFPLPRGAFGCGECQGKGMARPVNKHDCFWFEANKSHVIGKELERVLLSRGTGSRTEELQVTTRGNGEV